MGGVEAGHELAVGGAGCGEVGVAFGELQAQVDDLLFESGDLLVKGFDVGGGAAPGVVPGALAEGVGESPFEVLDSVVEPGGAFVPSRREESSPLGEAVCRSSHKTCHRDAEPTSHRPTRERRRPWLLEMHRFSRL